MDEPREDIISPVTIFYSYAHEDERYRKKLENHLSPMRQQGMIAEFHDRKIVPGTDWAKAIDESIGAAAVILLLISPDFIASDYRYGIEMQRALERHRAGAARVIPILLRPVDWKEASFAHLQPLPQNGKPVTRWRRQDDAFHDVAKGIREAIKSLPLHTKILPDNRQVASKEGDLHDEMDPPPRPQHEERKSYIGSDQIGSDQHMRIFVQQQEEFDLALSKSMPGKGSYTKTYIQAESKKVIDRVLSSLADACEACDLWWFAGYLHSPACPIKRLTEEVWLIQHNECKIIDLWVYRHPTDERQYVLLHLAPQLPFGLYNSDDANIDWEEAGYYKERYVTRGEYDDGYAEIDEEVIELHGVELRSRNLKDDFIVLVPKYSVYNQHTNNQQTVEVYQALRAAGKIDQPLLRPLEQLERPDWMGSWD